MVRKAYKDKIGETPAYALVTREKSVIINVQFNNALKECDGFIGACPQFPAGVFLLFNSKENRTKATEKLFWWKDNLEELKQTVYIKNEYLTEEYQRKSKERLNKGLHKELKELRKMEKELRAHGIEPEFTVDELEEKIKETNEKK